MEIAAGKPLPQANMPACDENISCYTTKITKHTKKILLFAKTFVPFVVLLSYADGFMRRFRNVPASDMIWAG